MAAIRPSTAAINTSQDGNISTALCSKNIIAAEYVTPPIMVTNVIHIITFQNCVIAFYFIWFYLTDLIVRGGSNVGPVMLLIISNIPIVKPSIRASLIISIVLLFFMAKICLCMNIWINYQARLFRRS